MQARRVAVASLALALALAGAPLRAHEFWIEPGNFTPRVGDAVTLRLRVGEQLQGRSQRLPVRVGLGASRRSTHPHLRKQYATLLKATGLRPSACP